MRIRKALQIAIPLAGIVLVFAAILVVPASEVQIQVGLALLGILMIEAGVWKLTSPFLPNDRKFTELREEVDSFIDLVRALNASALEVRKSDDPESREQYRAVLDEMHRAVDRMAKLAGKKVGEPPTAPPEEAT